MKHVATSVNKFLNVSSYFFLSHIIDRAPPLPAHPGECPWNRSPLEYRVPKDHGAPYQGHRRYSCVCWQLATHHTAHWICVIGEERTHVHTLSTYPVYPINWSYGLYLYIPQTSVGTDILWRGGLMDYPWTMDTGWNSHICTDLFGYFITGALIDNPLYCPRTYKLHS